MKPASILVVDDEPDLCDLISRMLMRAGHKVTCANDGDEASKAIARQKFDIVLTDVIMPEKDGIEVIAELRRKQPNVRIVAMSGGGHVSVGHYLKIAKGMGAHGVLQKPFGNDELLAALEAVMPPEIPPRA
ncbi:MAG TPA: response regulator [Opitutus sp.]|nr:response regulator [Opitutus sp.]